MWSLCERVFVDTTAKSRVGESSRGGERESPGEPLKCKSKRDQFRNAKMKINKNSRRAGWQPFNPVTALQPSLLLHPACSDIDWKCCVTWINFHGVGQPQKCVLSFLPCRASSSRKTRTTATPATATTTTTIANCYSFKVAQRERARERGGSLLLSLRR